MSESRSRKKPATPIIDSSEEVSTIADPETEPETAIASPKPDAIAEPTPDRDLIQYFENNGIPYCPKCFQQHRSSLDGSPICVSDRKDCPRIS